MSAQHPIIAVTGSSGAGTTTTSQALRQIFRTLSVAAALSSDSSTAITPRNGSRYSQGTRTRAAY